MIRKTFFLDKEQIDFLKSLPGTSSEHIRQAINEYKKKQQNVSASQSQTVQSALTRKEENNG